MDNNAQILSLFGEDNVPPDMLAFLQMQNSQQQPPSTDILPTAPAGNIKARIMQELGATPPDQGGSIQDILSGRFNQEGLGPSYGDYAQSAISSLNGKYASPDDVAQNRLGAQFKDIGEIAKAQLYMQGGMGRSGGASVFAQRLQLLKTDPATKDLPPATLMSMAASGIGQGQTYGPDGVTPITGAPQSAGAMEYGKKAGDQQAILETAAPIANASESGKEQGKIVTEAQANLPQVVDQAQQSIKVIDDVLKHPGLAANFGSSGMIPNRPGSEASDAKTYLDQIRGGSFLTAYNQLRGGGQISNTEGAKAEAAYARMTSAQSVKAFKQAAQDYKDIINKVVVRTRNTASGAAFNQPQTNTPLSSSPQSNIVDYTEYFK